MRVRRASAVLLILAGLGAGEALAQFPPAGAGPGQFPSASAPPGQFPPAGAPSPFPPAGAPGQSAAAPPGQGAEPPCFKDFKSLLDEANKRAKAIADASQKKVPPAEACVLFNRLGEAEEKVIKFLSANQAKCGIPDVAIKQNKTNYTAHMQIRTKICEAAKAPKAAGPSLSDALGIRTPLVDSDTQKPGYGMFDTLTGNVLAR
jgi:hypothetical protein